MRNHSRPLLAVYFPVGDPEVPIETLDVYAQSGVDVVEFGWPARDPYFDGPDVRASMGRALKGDPRAALREALRRLGKLPGVPVAEVADLGGPAWKTGPERGAYASAEVGDLGYGSPPKALLMTYAEDHHPSLADAALFRGLDAVLVVGRPGDPSRKAIEARAAAIAAFVPLPIDEENVAAARGADFYAMLQAAPGVTGPRATLDEDNGERIAHLRWAGVEAPILLGFGISDGAQARQAVQLGADGIVVGSAALRAARQGTDALEALLKDLRDGLDG